MALHRPWIRGEHVRSPWGPRVHPISGQRGKRHRGVDVAYHGPENMIGTKKTNHGIQ